MTITYEYGNNLYINLTNRCSNSCDFCLRNNSSGSLYAEDLWFEGAEPTKEEILADIMTRDLDRYEELVFCGYGEPACRWNDILWLCDRIREKSSITIRLNTNGQANLIENRDTVPETKGRFDVISVSLNAHTAEKYQALCHSQFGADAFLAILQFTSGAAAQVPKVYMTVVDTMPKEEIEACRKICEGCGAQFRVRQYINR